MTGFAGYKDGFVLLAYLMAAIVLTIRQKGEDEN